jgi:Site-specific DNA methylase
LLTLGSLFDGIGVFPLAASRYGITPLWASEIEKAPISITKRHFPGMAHLGDITKLNGGEIPAVHIITFGSPCQNLSLAGEREGLAGEKSGLYYQAIRIIEEMREATDGAFPVITVWENVMGAFSSNDRLDFRSVLQSFTNTEIPMPASGRWANAGMVRGRQPDIAWRLLDARHWGRPRLEQRRKRIFLISDFGGQRAAEILYHSGGVYEDTEACGAYRMSAAEKDRISAFETGREIPVIHPFQNRRMRGNAQKGDYTGFIGSFGKPTDPFPTLLAGDVTMFSLWNGGDYENGIIRYLTPLECERLMGLPEGWTKYGVEGNLIADGPRYKSLGNAIALPCAEYIIEGIADALKGGIIDD